MQADDQERASGSSEQITPVSGGLALPVGEVELAPLTEVPLQVEVRLGSAHLSLGDLLKLRAGTVVTLDRQVGEPAEIMVGDKVIALGQVVLVGNELGVRVTELPGSAGSTR